MPAILRNLQLFAGDFNNLWCFNPKIDYLQADGKESERVGRWDVQGTPGACNYGSMRLFVAW